MTNLMTGKPGEHYGCHNRDRPFKPTFLAQDGYHQIGGNIQSGLQHVPKYKVVKFKMSHDCRYDNQATDARCAGCKHIKGDHEDQPTDEGAGAAKRDGFYR